MQQCSRVNKSSAIYRPASGTAFMKPKGPSGAEPALGTRLLGISGFLGCCNLFAASLLLGLLSPAVSKLGAWAWGPPGGFQTPVVSKLGAWACGPPAVSKLGLAWLGASGGGLGLGPPALSKLGLGFQTGGLGLGPPGLASGLGGGLGLGAPAVSGGPSLAWLGLGLRGPWGLGLAWLRA